MDSIILLTLILLTLIVIYFVYKRNINKEDFTNNNNEKVLIKKTIEYEKIYSPPSKEYYVWEPKRIDDYYPIGQVITKNNVEPTYPSILIKSNRNGLDKPIKYIIVAKTEDNLGVYRIISSKGYKTLGHIVSKNKPSIHNYRCIPKTYCSVSNYNDKIYKGLDYSLWSIDNSNYFRVNNEDNHKLPIEKAYSLNENKFEKSKYLDIKQTNKYKKIWSNTNEVMNKSVTIWRPIAPKNYISLGDIALKSDINPNGDIYTDCVSKDQVKEPLNFGKKYHSIIKNGDNVVTFWKPVAPPGYIFLGFIANQSEKEPNNNNIIGCIDILNTIENKNRVSIWNNLPNNNKLEISVNSNNRFTVLKNNESNYNNLILNSNTLKKQRDLTDTSRIIEINYVNNDNNKNIENYKLITKLIKDTFKHKFNLNEDRITDISYNTNEKIIKFKVLSRYINTNEVTVGEFIKLLLESLMIHSIKIYTKDKRDYVIDLIYAKVLPLNNIMLLDNSNFNEALN